MSERPAIISVQQDELGDQARVVVTLGWQDAQYSGEAVGDNNDIARTRLLGEATLRAVEQVADNRVALSLAAVATTDLGEAQIAMAQVMMEGMDQLMVGSALLRESDATRATVRAVLDAINRRLTQVLR
jgi:ABC-type uncharacterized transport system permease subunit